MKKTNALRLLDQEKIPYSTSSYDVKDGKVDGKSVAEKIGRTPETVYKTLVTHQGQNLYVFVIPVLAELDLKKAAKVVNEKKIEMLPMKDLQKYTGYVRGGCSPVGMKKMYATVIDQTAEKLPTIVVSAGKVGMQMELSPHDLAKLTKAKFSDVIK